VYAPNLEDRRRGRGEGTNGADPAYAAGGAVGVPRDAWPKELLSWMGFTSTFAAVRAITYSIRAGRGPFGNVSLGGAHLHHYRWGIAMLSGVGGIAVRGEDSTRRHPAVALTYGAGMALIVDEFALLLDLQDVYWAKQAASPSIWASGWWRPAGPRSARSRSCGGWPGENHTLPERTLACNLPADCDEEPRWPSPRN